MSEDTTDTNFSGLDNLLKAMRQQKLAIHVGVLGQNSRGDGKGLTNADIGSFHELEDGSSRMPRRSFLQVPIKEVLPKRLSKAQNLSKDALAEILRKGSFRPILLKIGAEAVGVVLDAFDTGGFGKWPAWKNSHYKNNAGQLLVDTGQLRNAITFEVVGND